MLYLGGGGDNEISVKIDETFFSCLSDEAKILYIPIACDFTIYKNCLEWFEDLAKSYLENPQIDMYIDEKPDFASYDAIYIGGGNTYKLMDFVAKNNLKDDFIAFLRQNKPIFGGSAGAIIWGSSLETVIEEKENYPDNQPLSMLGDYAVRCHYTAEEDEEFANISIRLKKPVLAIAEDAGIIFDGKDFAVVGKVYIFNNGKKN